MGALALAVYDEVSDGLSRQLYLCSERIAMNEIGDLFGAGWLGKKIADHGNGLVCYDCMCRRVRSPQPAASSRHSCSLLAQPTLYKLHKGRLAMAQIATFATVHQRPILGCSSIASSTCLRW